MRLCMHIHMRIWICKSAAQRRQGAVISFKLRLLTVMEFHALTTIGRKERREEFSKPLTTLVRSLEGVEGGDGAVGACSQKADRAEMLRWG